MGNEQQIDELNERVKVRIAPSPIHGVGIVAIRDIGKGQKLYLNHTPKVYSLPYAQFPKLFDAVSAIILERWPQVAVGKSLFAYPDACYQAYTNHADDPNYDTHTDCALRDIKAGEEITEDYRLIDGWEKVFPWLVSLDKTK